MNDPSKEFLRLLNQEVPADERLMGASPSEATMAHGDDAKQGHKDWWSKPIDWDDVAEGYRDQRKHNHFVCISSVKRSKHPETGKVRFWRKDFAFGRGLALMVDDIGSGKGSKGGLTVADLAKRLRPTAVIETSPDNFQVWYFLREPVTDIDLFKRFIRSFIKYVLGTNGDTTIRDAMRLARSPFGVNNKRLHDGSWKYATEDGTPWKVRIAHLDHTRRYTIDEIAAKFQFEIDQPPRRVTPDRLLGSLNEYWYKIGVRVMSQARQGEHGMPLDEDRHKHRVQCPWGHLHGNGDRNGAQLRGPSDDERYEHDYVFSCSHDTCSCKDSRDANGRPLPMPAGKYNRTWATFVDHIVIPAIHANLERAAARVTFEDLQGANLP